MEAGVRGPDINLVKAAGLNGEAMGGGIFVGSKLRGQGK